MKSFSISEIKNYVTMKQLKKKMIWESYLGSTLTWFSCRTNWSTFSLKFRKKIWKLFFFLMTNHKELNYNGEIILDYWLIDFNSMWTCLGLFYT